MKILFVTLEFADPIFSGNGVYSRSIVDILVKKGYEVTVVSGTDSESKHQNLNESKVSSNKISADHEVTDPTTTDSVSKSTNETKSAITSNPHILSIPLKIWGRLDRYSGWEEMCEKSQTDLLDFDLDSFDLLMSVDWTGAAVLEAIKQKAWQIQNDQLNDQIRIPWIAFIFRIFCAKNTEFSQQDKDFYRKKEQKITQEANIVLSCSKVDSELLLEEANKANTAIDSSNLRALNPPLRDAFLEEIQMLEAESKQQSDSQVQIQCEQQQSSDSESQIQFNNNFKLLLCCCRLSVEKRVHFFVDVLCASEDLKKFLKIHNIIPLIVGAKGGDQHYNEVRILNKIRSHYHSEGVCCCPELIQELGSTMTSQESDCNTVSDANTNISHVKPLCDLSLCGKFLTPRQLMKYVFSKTILNFHPALYDSYAMTVAESAACGVGSVIHKPELTQENSQPINTIGAAEVLLEDGIIRIAMEPPESSDQDSDSKSDSEVSYNIMVKSAAAELLEILKKEVDHGYISEMTERAKKRSLNWTSKEMGNKLVDMVEELVGKG